MYVAGLKGTIDKLADKLGRIARPSTTTDLLTCRQAWCWAC
jgi:hypothetical protein